MALHGKWQYGSTGSDMRHAQKEWLKNQRAYYQARRRFANDTRFAAVGAVLRSVFRSLRTVLFYPDYPSRDSSIFKICAAAGYGISDCMRDPRVAVFKWKDATFFDAAELEKIPQRPGKILNGGSLDISKRTVQRVFKKTFGYPLEVNPLEFNGEILEKSDANATHDGRILRGPLKSEDLHADRVYQKAIDNTVGDLVFELRVPIIGDNIPLVFRKYRTLENRFAVPNRSATMEEPQAVFSPAERTNLLSMARELGIDYGELDVLRDKDDRIYVVDANNTPCGPPNVLTRDETRVAVMRQAAAFKKWLER